MRRGEIWLAEAGTKPRPVVVLTRDAVLDVRAAVTVAEVTTQGRGLSVEVPLEADTGIDEESVVNADGLHTVPQGTLTRRLGMVGDTALEDICTAVTNALDCTC